MQLTHLPYKLSGKVYRSPMPYSLRYDPSRSIYPQFKVNNIQTIVLLADDDECIARSGRNLRRYYETEGFEVIHMPIKDYGVPADKDALGRAVVRAYTAAKQGRNVAIHCHAGVGRTGTFAACLAQKLLGLTGNESITWVREHIPGAIETPEQEELVRTFGDLA